jgi:hypothetical protein
MVRDGRGAALSLVKRYNESMNALTLKKYLKTWNSYNYIVNIQCKHVGSEYCLLVKYEDLVMKTKETVKKIADFLNLTWTDEFLHHERYVGNKVIVSETEWSTDQMYTFLLKI